MLVVLQGFEPLADQLHLLGASFTDWCGEREPCDRVRLSNKFER